MAGSSTQLRTSSAAGWKLWAGLFAGRSPSGTFCTATAFRSSRCCSTGSTSRLKASTASTTVDALDVRLTDKLVILVEVSVCQDFCSAQLNAQLCRLLRCRLSRCNTLEPAFQHCTAGCTPPLGGKPCVGKSAYWSEGSAPQLQDNSE